MTPSEIIEQLRFLQREIPRQALKEAVDQRAAVAPLLIRAIDEVAADPERFAGQTEYMLHIYALYLLAEMRESRALPAILRLFSLPGELPYDLTGDVITLDGAQILASVCGGDIAPLLRLFENERADHYVRDEALSALVVLAAWGEWPREKVIACFRELLGGKLPRVKNSPAWTSLAGAVYDLNARELIPDITRAFDEGLVNREYIDLDTIVEWHDEADIDPFREFAEAHQPILNTADQFEGWDDFAEDEDDSDDPAPRR